jgi:hypothetical protein
LSIWRERKKERKKERKVSGVGGEVGERDKAGG